MRLAAVVFFDFVFALFLVTAHGADLTQTQSKVIGHPTPHPATQTRGQTVTETQTERGTLTISDEMKGVTATSSVRAKTQTLWQTVTGTSTDAGNQWATVTATLAKNGPTNHPTPRPGCTITATSPLDQPDGRSAGADGTAANTIVVTATCGTFFVLVVVIALVAFLVVRRSRSHFHPEGGMEEMPWVLGEVLVAEKFTNETYICAMPQHLSSKECVATL